MFFCFLYSWLGDTSGEDIAKADGICPLRGGEYGKLVVLTGVKIAKITIKKCLKTLYRSRWRIFFNCNVYICHGRVAGRTRETRGKVNKEV